MMDNRNVEITESGDTSALSDADLLALHLRSGTNEYLGILYARYMQLVYGVALKYMRNMDDACDAVPAVFEHIVSRIGRYDIGEFGGWLHAVTKNYCLQKLRRRGDEIIVDFSDRVMENATLLHLLNDSRDSARKAKEEKLFDVLECCIAKLPEKQRECIELFFFNHKSYVDITAATCYQLKSVKSYIQNGKRNLKLCMEKGNHEID